MRLKIFILAFALVILVSAVFVKLFVYDFRPSKRFVSAVWIAGNERLRGQMVNSLIGSHLLEGKGSNEVVNLIGLADNAGTNRWRYHVDVGLRFGGRPWRYDLILDFDQNNKVSKIVLLD